MSRCINQFASIITQPLNIYNFKIVIKNAVDEVNEKILLTVQSTTFPAETLRETTLNYKGEEIHYPAKPTIGGDWTFTIPDNDNGMVHAELDRLKNAMYDQKTGTMTPTLWYDVEVMQLDLSDNIVKSAIMHGCWLKGKDNTSLDTSNVTTSWSNTYTFRYAWLENKNIDGLKGTPNPMGTAE